MASKRGAYSQEEISELELVNKYTTALPLMTSYYGNLKEICRNQLDGVLLPLP